MRIAVVTCKVKPPSADLINNLETDDKDGDFESTNVVSTTSAQNKQEYRLPAQNDDFVRELIQLCNFHGKSKQVLYFLNNK